LGRGHDVVHFRRQEDAAAPRKGSAERVSGLVLCGGRSARMGRDKARLSLGDTATTPGALVEVPSGKSMPGESLPGESLPGESMPGDSMIERALRVVAAVTPDVRLACGPTQRYEDLDVPLVCDRIADAGPLAGIEAGLAAAPDGLVVVLACDMPHADAHTLAALLRHARAHDLDVCCLRSERGVEPLCAVWSTRLLPVVRAALERRESGVQSLIASLPRTDALDVAAGPAGTDPSFNVNTPADLERARRHVNGRKGGEERSCA